MYVQGVSTRRVSAVLESLCTSQTFGFDRHERFLHDCKSCRRRVDTVLVAWRDRPLGVFPFVQCDAIWVKIRQNGLVRDAAVLVASGVDESGKRSLLGVSVSAGESELHWRSLFESLIARGLRGIRMITSDSNKTRFVLHHSGMGAARRAVFGGVAWQRCQFHLQQNAQAYVPKEEMKKVVVARIRTIFNAPDLMTAQGLLRAAVKEFETIAPRLSRWMEEAILEGLTVFTLPEQQRRFLRTSNGFAHLQTD